MIPDLDRVEDWDKRRLVPNEQVWKGLKEIGAAYGEPFPCRCLTKSNEQVDCCIIDFVDFPPLREGAFRVLMGSGKGVVPIDEVVTVAESEYAVSPEVHAALRRASTLFGVRKGGVASITVRTGQGQSLLLATGTVFVDMPRCKGSDLLLLPEPPSYEPADYNEDVSKRTAIIADWDEGYYGLL